MARSPNERTPNARVVRLGGREFITEGLDLNFWTGDQPISNVPGGAYIDYLYFSIETLSTAGYGDMHPQTHYGHFVATVELFTGIFSMSLMTGLIFARFSRPNPRLLFADSPVISDHEGE